MQHRLLVCLLLLVLVAACQPAPQVPTLQATAMPDTETPIPDASLTPIPPSDTPFVRPTLPPTWTRVPTDTPEPTPTEVLPTPTPFVQLRPTSTGCASFFVDYDNTDVEFPIGTAPVINWFPVEGETQVAYLLSLVRSNGRLVRDQLYTGDTQWAGFEWTDFELGEIYAVRIIALDSAGFPLCPPAGVELVPVPR